MHSLPDQTFDMTGEYYTLHWYDLDSYDRRFAILDVRWGNERLDKNKEFNDEEIYANTRHYTTTSKVYLSYNFSSWFPKK